MLRRAKEVDDWIATQPVEMRAGLVALRELFLTHVPEGYEEMLQWGTPSYAVPHSTYPHGYHCDPKQALPFASFGASKTHLRLSIMGTYLDRDEDKWFRAAWTAAGKKLDMGKACVRFKKLEDLPLDVVAEALRRWPVDRYVSRYEQNLPQSAMKRRSK